jgi:hypothetical protein
VLEASAYRARVDPEASRAHRRRVLDSISATGVMTNSLFTAYRLLQLDEAFAMCESVASFVLDDLPRSAGDGEFCWGYSPGDRQRVLNATMEGARLCARSTR